MATLSIIEFLVYGLIAYSGVVMMIISTIKDVPSTKSGSIYRVIWLLPCAIILLFLAFAVTEITTESGTTTETTTSDYETLNTSDGVVVLNSTTTNTITKSNIIYLINPIWITFHFMLFIVLVVYIIIQALNLLTKLE